jgi:hypothetical protein
MVMSCLTSIKIKYLTEIMENGKKSCLVESIISTSISFYIHYFSLKIFGLVENSSASAIALPPSPPFQLSTNKSTLKIIFAKNEKNKPYNIFFK